MDRYIVALTPAKALKYFMQYTDDFEKGEILDYKQVYFLGLPEEDKGLPCLPVQLGLR